jgi:RNA polymerase sigma-70 factor (ECF subfamily)
MTPGTPAGPDRESGGFHTTHWSLILASLDAESGDRQAREALAQLCRIYWRPIFAFICHKGHSVPDAQDLTQDFFMMVLQGKLLERADRSRGRFRSLLLRALQNFMIDAYEKRRAQKRGGDAKFVAWDEWMAEAPSQLSVPMAAASQWPAETVFDVRWAATLAEQALRRLQEECERHGRRRVFDALSGALTAEREDISYAAMARDLGVEESKIKPLLHQMRLRYRQLLRAEVSATIENPADLDDELRYLCTALVASTSS